MNLLDINIQNYIPDIVDAYTKVYGTENGNVIERRISKINYVMYNNIDGMRSYVYFLEECKKKELAIKFLKQIGIDVSKQEGKSYAEDLDTDIDTLIDKYIGGYYLGIEPRLRNSPRGIKAFGNLPKDVDAQIVKEEKIELINFLRGQNATPITSETFR